MPRKPAVSERKPTRCGRTTTAPSRRCPVIELYDLVSVTGDRHARCRCGAAADGQDERTVEPSWRHRCETCLARRQRAEDEHDGVGHPPRRSAGRSATRELRVLLEVVMPSGSVTAASTMISCQPQNVNEAIGPATQPRLAGALPPRSRRLRTRRSREGEDHRRWCGAAGAGGRYESHWMPSQRNKSGMPAGRRR